MLRAVATCKAKLQGEKVCAPSSTLSVNVAFKRKRRREEEGEKEVVKEEEEVVEEKKEKFKKKARH